MAADTATVENSVYKRILCEFRDAANGCICNRSTTPGIVERTEGGPVNVEWQASHGVNSIAY